STATRLQNPDQRSNEDVHVMESIAIAAEFGRPQGATNLSKDKPQTQLHGAVPRSRQDPGELGIVHVRVRGIQAVMVQEVVRLGAELRELAFRDVKVLQQRQIRLPVLAGTPQAVPLQI